mmetsp:Transcript_3301/g.9606  ORF Transcript_3301/g.9606 Transcript_3301/m.9606 type:complete len:221 (+) Transcript_3301:801-1463(+)
MFLSPGDGRSKSPSTHVSRIVQRVCEKAPRSPASKTWLSQATSQRPTTAPHGDISPGGSAASRASRLGDAAMRAPASSAERRPALKRAAATASLSSDGMPAGRRRKRRLSTEGGSDVSETSSFFVDLGSEADAAGSAAQLAAGKFQLSRLDAGARARLADSRRVRIKGMTKFHGDIVLLASFEEGTTDLVLAKEAKRLFPDVYFDYLESLLVFEKAKDEH